MGINILQERVGSECPKCNFVFFDKTEKCQHCEGPTVPIKWYERLCVERLAFIFTVPVITVIGAFISGEDSDKFIGIFFGVGFITLAIYVTANMFIGIGGFIEKFVEDTIPERAYLTFSWRYYFSELFRIVVIAIALLLFIGIGTFFNWVMAGSQ